MDMDGDSYLRFILALVLVLGLLALAAFLLRRSGIAPKLGRSRRLSAVESLPIGPKHRLLLVRRDNVEHLLLLGPQGDLVVEGDIVGGSSTAAKGDPGKADDSASRRFAEMVDPTLQIPASNTTRPQSFNESH